MGSRRRRRSFSDSSDSDAESESSSEGDEEGRQSNSGSDQEADNWVLCDRCTKWRRIPAAFVDQIKEDTPWYCEHNPNKAFASCSVPQELTNEEIDAEGDSDGAGESDHDEESLKRRRIPAVWQLLKDNILAHRKRKVQDEDDIMICHCKPTWRGGDGCGPDCINRMLCIECVPGFCPSEDKCTNQMFSKRMYANLEIRRAGAKGFGLFALEDIKAGQFIIEYIGEVLEEDEYQRRKEYYMSVGQRHYYFMNIGNGEVIDACRKGNISRFINHSCEPNCETQKWLVRGELAIGLFAVRDIPKETELTFDYNFERYGDKPMRCYCGSTNCRSFIGGMQDNFDVSLLPVVEPDDASHDLPPIMLTDSEMDPNMRMLLEWRVGTKVDKAKEIGMVTRLERLCKARNVVWTVKHFYGQEPIPTVQQPQIQAPAPSTSAHGSASDKREKQPTSEVTGTPAPKVKDQRKADKAAAGAAAAGPTSKGKASGTSAAKQLEAGTGLPKLRLDDAAPSGTPMTGPAAGSARHPPAVTPEVGQVRGPKALFKQWKIMQQQDTTPLSAVEEKTAVTPSSPPSTHSQHSPPSPQSPPSPRSSLLLDNDDAALDEARNAATEAARRAPLRRRLRRVPPKPLAAADGAVEHAENDSATATANQTAAAAAAGHGDGSGTGSTGASATPAVQVSSGVVARKNSLGSGGAPPASIAAGISYSPPRSTSPPLPSSTGGRGGAGGAAVSNRKLRSEIDRRLEEVVGSNGRLKDPSRQNVIKVLRLFNLCDIGGAGRGSNGFGSAAGGRYLNGGGMSRNGDELGMPGPGPGSTGVLTARQRARMADLSLLLDVIIKTTSSAAKKELVACGLLTQLHQAMARNTGKEYSVILRKVLRAVEGLPLEANDVYAVRTAHGNFADMLRQLSSNADYDVRTKAAALLKKFPPSAVTDQRLLQLMAAPPVRFGSSRGCSGMRSAPFSIAGGGGGGGGGMMLLAMQQQMMQQQLLKQQMMMRMKDAGVGGSNGLPPPPPLMPAAASTSGDGTGACAGDSMTTTGPSLHRTNSTISLEEDPTDGEQAGLTGLNGPTGLPPLGPGRQRGPAASVPVLGSRAGHLRAMMGRMGASGMAGPMGNGAGAMVLTGMGRGGVIGSVGMGPSPLGFPPRPPSPASMDPYSSHNGGGAGADEGGSYNASKRRKFSHPHSQDGLSASVAGAPPFASGAVLPGPPPRPPYSLVSGGVHFQHHHYHNSHAGFTPNRRGTGFHDAIDGSDRDRDHTGAPLPPPSWDLPGPPPRSSHAYQQSYHNFLWSRRGSEDRCDPTGDPPELLTAEQLFTLQRPMRRPTLLPPIKGEAKPELTDVITLFALGLYGSYGCPEQYNTTADVEDELGCCWSPVVSTSGPPMSPILEPPPPPVLTASTLELPPPPPHSSSGVTASVGAPWEGAQLRPLRTQPGTVGATGPSPYHQHSSPSPYSGWDPVPSATGAAHGPASAASTPTLSGFGCMPASATGGGGGGFQPPSSAPGSASAAAAAGSTGLPPVVPISSLSDWRIPTPVGPPQGSSVDVSAASGMPAPGILQASPLLSPEPQLGAATVAASTIAAAGRSSMLPHGGGAGGCHGGEAENIEDWLRPVSAHHADVWEEPNASFEAYVADMVRHRLGKYLQPEHPSRVSVQEAHTLRAKVYREVVAKERRAWEERRSAGVYKPIERHKLEANLKEFVRSTIKRMRDREKERVAGVPGGPMPGGPPQHGAPGHPRTYGAHGQMHHYHHQHHHQQQQQHQPYPHPPAHPQQQQEPQRLSLPIAHGYTPQPGLHTPPRTDAASTPQPPGFAVPRLSPSPVPDGNIPAVAALGQAELGSAGGGIKDGEGRKENEIERRGESYAAGRDQRPLDTAMRCGEDAREKSRVAGTTTGRQSGGGGRNDCTLDVTMTQTTAA
ncbi:hypothetical protein Vretimale_10000 [Volvox reticuliferus]|uniref:Uncharacterized protein n=1 Tax=Volvox reticuliferus TaxID=1737510 RepID=A0A8J4CWM1_9CHLO|nr:hypothetical protein Vretifemale_18849 [Volvox reticuliferus]GIM05534.1 hypothetical protein Vretimale_10000 [Volvox reticuliferus]